MIHSFLVNDPYLRTQFLRYGVIHIPQFIDKFDALELRQQLYDSFSASRDALVGEDAIAPGCRVQVWRDRPLDLLPRKLRLMYEPPTRPVFQQLIDLRNYLAGLPRDFAMRGPERGWWTAARFNHYPRGGGFMATHTDLPHLPEHPPGEYAQPVLFLSHKGSHYHDGGGHVDGEDIDAMCEPGDVIVYGGRVPHGVSPVDPDITVPNPSTLDGRLVAMVTLYKAQA